MKPKTHLKRKIYLELADAQGFFSLVFILN